MRKIRGKVTMSKDTLAEMTRSSQHQNAGLQEIQVDARPGRSISPHSIPRAPVCSGNEVVGFYLRNKKLCPSDNRGTTILVWASPLKALGGLVLLVREGLGSSLTATSREQRDCGMVGAAGSGDGEGRTNTKDVTAQLNGGRISHIFLYSIFFLF